MTYQFGLFEFDTETSELRAEGRRVPLEPQPARALALLLVRAGTVVSREELRTHIWGDDTHVDFDRGLAYCIAQLRAALRDSADNPRFVQTLPRRGFKFIAPVIASSSSAERPVASKRTPVPRRLSPGKVATALLALAVLSGGTWIATRRAHRAPRPIVAVAVFDNETGDARYEHIVQQLSDVAVHRLTELGPDRLGVIGNMAVLRQPRERRDLNAIARETRAAFIILGQLQPKDGRLSLLLQLIRVDDGTHVWVTRIARPADDGLANIDEEAAKLIEEAVRDHVLGPRRS